MQATNHEVYEDVPQLKETFCYLMSVFTSPQTRLVINVWLNHMTLVLLFRQLFYFFYSFYYCAYMSTTQHEPWFLLTRTYFDEYPYT